MDHKLQSSLESNHDRFAPKSFCDARPCLDAFISTGSTCFAQICGNRGRPNRRHIVRIRLKQRVSNQLSVPDVFAGVRSGGLSFDGGSVLLPPFAAGSSADLTFKSGLRPNHTLVLCKDF